MQIQFYKYQGTGNDFVIIDDRQQLLPDVEPLLYQKLCNRRLGVGADGVILLRNHPNFDFEMKYYNANGNEGSMCGNGGRCIVSFANKLGIIDTNTDFLACDGAHKGKVENQRIHLLMNNVDKYSKKNHDYDLDTGSPHYVQFIKDLAGFDIFGQGYAIRNNETYKEKGTNVNFVEIVKDNQLEIATFERGVEDVTWSCGTGVTAASIAYLIHTESENGEHHISIKTKGGDLAVKLTKSTPSLFENIWLIGPAENTFSGTIEI